MGIGILFLLITFKGRQPALLCTVRFINSKGSIILLIGLDDRDSSPVNVIFNPLMLIALLVILRRSGIV